MKNSRANAVLRYEYKALRGLDFMLFLLSMSKMDTILAIS